MQQIIAGVDEVGRGPLAGPVIAAAVILDIKHEIKGLADSKLLSEKRRNELAVLIKQHSVAWALGRAEVEEIDSINILQASLLAMQRAVAKLNPCPEHVLVDGNTSPKLHCSVDAIIKGDQTVASISAASIIAKVSRDAEMVSLSKRYPDYGFERHKGYPTKAHLKALQLNGVTPIHRRSFGPVKKLCEYS